MDPTQTGPIALAERRLHWLDARQRVLAQNMANLDTPGYRPSDLRPFAETLARTGSGLARTNAAHAGGGRASDVRADRQLVERTPDGNGVSLEDQALKVADTDTAHALALSLHRRFLTMFRTALGRTG
ncbi:flagellar basal body protein [Plastoroseomonas arctica]|uniref:Flagellar biosynthesis protein FlgB n=1 Tax=Plastoroseomonas arctica TaxID=1509237 RepID=A0AAF1JXS1_9PROT|nr:flagellar basal body protein [Plastoroseomonas arctica]MBR0656392.1 flagellar biosynthesis protein FlgB [Plastoroseomonas arctica]